MLVGVSLALALLGAFLVRKVGKQVSRPVQELTRSAVHAIASDDDVPLSQQQRRDERGVAEDEHSDRNAEIGGVDITRSQCCHDRLADVGVPEAPRHGIPDGHDEDGAAKRNEQMRG